MTYGYSRCSTNESKQDLNRQTRELKQAGADVVFEEYEHGDAENKRELCGGAELAGFYGTDCIAGNTHHFCECILRKIFFASDFFKMIF